jgi:hypothetical protein
LPCALLQILFLKDHYAIGIRAFSALASLTELVLAKILPEPNIE